MPWPCLRSLPLSATVLSLVFVQAAPVQAQPVSNSSLYYRMGGGTPMGGPLNGRQTALRLGFNSRANYSCGKFDVGLSWGNLMNSFANLGTTVSAGIQAGIAALPLYVLQRAQPGLYQLFQNFSQKADVLVASSLRSCEEMEAQIKRGQDPYEDWVNMAKGDAWKVKANASGDVVQAKYDINRDEQGQKAGLDWLFGARAGGAGQRPIQPIRDLAIAGYNSTLNLAATSSANQSYGTSSFASTRLVQAFESPEKLAAWTTEVLGDEQIWICTQDASCPHPTTTNTAVGLGPKLDAELQSVAPTLQAALAPGNTEFAGLKQLGTPGYAVSPQLIESIRQLPPESRAMAAGRIAQELSMQRVIDKALIARGVLLTGLSLPQATKAGQMQKDAHAKVDRLTAHINDLMFEHRVRKEMASDTAVTIMSEQFYRDSQGTRVRNAAAAEARPLTDGRVAP
jgi:integrating conjugative element protein (TIGR03755 family)